MPPVIDQRTVLQSWASTPAYQPDPADAALLARLTGRVVASDSNFDTEINVFQLVSNIEKYSHFIDNLRLIRDDVAALRNFLGVHDPDYLATFIAQVDSLNAEMATILAENSAQLSWSSVFQFARAEFSTLAEAVSGTALVFYNGAKAAAGGLRTILGTDPLPNAQDLFATKGGLTTLALVEIGTLLERTYALSKEIVEANAVILNPSSVEAQADAIGDMIGVVSELLDLWENFASTQALTPGDAQIFAAIGANVVQLWNALQDGRAYFEVDASNALDALSHSLLTDLKIVSGISIVDATAGILGEMAKLSRPGALMSDVVEWKSEYLLGAVDLIAQVGSQSLVSQWQLLQQWYEGRAALASVDAGFKTLTLQALGVADSHMIAGRWGEGVTPLGPDVPPDSVNRLFETDDAPGDGTTPYWVRPGETFRGTILTADGDTGTGDWVRVTLVAGQEYRFVLRGEGNFAQLRLMDATGTLLANQNPLFDRSFTQDGVTIYERVIEGTALTGGTHYLAVNASWQMGYTLTPTSVDLPDTLAIIGSPRQNSPLTVDTSTIPDDYVQGAFRYQWFAGNVAIEGANANSFTPGQAQVGELISVRVSFTSRSGREISLTGPETARIANINDAPTGAVTIAGVARLGQVLQAQTDTVGDLDGLGAFTFQWVNDGRPIPGATRQSLALTPDLVGRLVSVELRYRDGAGTSEVLTSATSVIIGPSEIDGGAGNDVLVGTSFHDLIRGGLGRDTVQGGDGRDTIYGGAGDDSLAGGGSGDLIFGEDGNDTLNGDAGSDTISGGAGDDVLSGDTGADLLQGGIGADTLLGATGNDTLLGEDGNDVLSGGSGADQLFGGDGADLLEGGSGRDLLEGDVGNDTLLGGSENDTLRGGGGDDHLIGASGMDLLEGGAGHDLLEGGSGADTLLGGSGNDTLRAGTGADVLTGGSGIDHFVFAAVGDMGLGNARDRITDFSGDVLDLTAIGGLVFNPGGFIGGGVRSVTFDTANALLRVDSLGNGIAVGEVLLVGVTSFDSASLLM